ncbi:hypothetical protein C0991_004482 [Blastosporella zonata]|nr:hypothetical protein C0991_004482 [Blastosporella zonata]
MDNDTSWCPVCDRAIQPKRYQVPIQQPPPPPPPSSPVRRTNRQRGGLVQGTGRVKPNGALKDPPVRLRTVIDQGPTPLYCSDECHLVDSNRVLPHNFHPDRHSNESVSSITSTTTSNTSSDDTSSASSISPPSVNVPHSIAVLAKAYGWGDLPPPAPVDDQSPKYITTVPDYDNGILMTGRRISALLPPPQRRNALGHIIPPKVPHPIIPGWNDGSNGWRATLYNVNPADSSTPVPHKSFATRGSRCVQSTLSTPREPPPKSPTTASESESVQAERMLKWSQSFRRPSQTSTPTPSSPNTARSSPVSSVSYPPSRRSILAPGVKDLLLVPEVMKKASSSSSSSSISSQYSAPASRRQFPSHLTQESSTDHDNAQRSESTASLGRPKRPTVESQSSFLVIFLDRLANLFNSARSWSYDNVKTYPTMRMPPTTKLEKRKEIQVVDGKEVEVEVEVEVQEKPKRLFLFASSFPAPPVVRY